MLLVSHALVSPGVALTLLFRLLRADPGLRCFFRFHHVGNSLYFLGIHT